IDPRLFHRRRLHLQPPERQSEGRHPDSGMTPPRKRGKINAADTTAGLRPVKSLAWLTDLHLNFLREPAQEAFLSSLVDTAADAFLLGGDIGEAPNVARYLNALDNTLQRPIYLVLGNHDFYKGSIAGVRAEVRQLCAACPNLHYLADAGVVPLTAKTCL